MFLAPGLLNRNGMKTNRSKPNGHRQVTLAELVATVNQMTHNDRLSAVIVADLINSRRVRLEGAYHGRRVHVG
jgi:hypothetical protein